MVRYCKKEQFGKSHSKIVLKMCTKSDVLFANIQKVIIFVRKLSRNLC